MSVAMNYTLQRFQQLPPAVPAEGAVRIDFEDGRPVLRASSAVQGRIEYLLRKQREAGLAQDEERELDAYEDLDDYFSLVNRLVRDTVPAGEPTNTP